MSHVYPEPYHCEVCSDKQPHADGMDKGFLCPDCQTELITPYRNCDLAGHCVTCGKTYSIDSLETQP